MHAYLFINPDLFSIETKILELSGNARIIHYRLEKIADTRELVRQTNMALSQKTLYLLNDFDTASIEAQNAFLKRLEEPAENLIFVLTAKSEARVLPTIISRCEVIRTANKKGLSEESVGTSLAEVSKITTRDDAIAYLENLINFLYDDLPKNAKAVKLADETLARIKANANPTLQLTHLAIGLQ